jgi:hypothetical protein
MTVLRTNLEYGKEKASHLVQSHRRGGAFSAGHTSTVRKLSAVTGQPDVHIAADGCNAVIFIKALI